MSDRHIELALLWLEKADHDLITASETENVGSIFGLTPKSMR